MSEASVTIEPWQQLAEVIDSANAEYLANFLNLLPPEETAYTISHLDEEHQTKMLGMLAEVKPHLAADLLEHFADEHAADMVERLDPDLAAAIFDQMDSDEQTDVLGELHEDDAEAILDQMAPEEAVDARRRLEYEHDTAGGLMITEILAFNRNQPVESVVAKLREKAEANQEYELRYVYVVDEAGQLVGVVPMRRLVLSRPGRPLTDLMAAEPITCDIRCSLDDLDDLFDRVMFSAVPVLEADGKLVGVVQRAAVEEALGERADEQLAKFGGIIFGEELRSMPWGSRTLRRMAFLLPNVVLSTVSVIVILLYEPVIHRITLLAVFLPLVANLSGAAGNQAVAVSIRELSLGLVRPVDWVRVCTKEVGVGLCNGLVIGVMLGLVAAMLGWMSMRLGWVEPQTRVGLLPLSVVVMLSYTLNCVLAVMLGGTIPLALRGLKVDPAMASSPVLTTMTDMCSFLLTLTFALVMLHVWIGA